MLPEVIRHPKVLVIDDHDASRYATSRILRGAGFEVIEGASGGEALARVNENVDLIVLDINLPDMDGFEVCRQLRARAETAYLPIVHLSATFTNTVDVEQGLKAGADSYLTHPADPVVLIATIRALIFARDADATRRTADARFRTVFELASSGIAMLDSKLVFTDVNAAFCALAGRERSALIGVASESLIAPGMNEKLEHLRTQLERAGHWEGTLPVIRGDGSRADVEWRIAAEKDSGSRIAIATDITERRRAEAERERLLISERAARAEAEHSNQLKDEFLAVLSHELRNPLNAILGWATVLRRAPGTTPAIMQGLEAIERNSRLQSHLIADLLDFAGIRFGKMRLELQVLDPSSVLRSALEVTAQQAQSKGLRVECRVDDAGSCVLADEARLQQVVWNLLSNAIKFTPRGGRVELSARTAGDFYEIAVSDTGRGISAEFLPKLFDRFSQQDSGTSKSFAGLGIGLTIVKHLVNMHRGTIEVSSEGEGHGATFRVRLPLTLEKARRSVATTAAVLSGVQVLVVEDDDDARALISRLLTDAGARVTEASGADDALGQVAQSVPGLVVSDIGMAKQDGYQLVRALRAAGYSAERLPAIALTAFSRTEDRSDAIEAGFQMHLSKPVNAEALISAAAGLTGRRS